ncbi:MAG: hypothetical protein QOJ40_3041 [Verrucomicrobiota bacterium]
MATELIELARGRELEFSPGLETTEAVPDVRLKSSGISLFYHAGLMIVALAMIVLPAIYLAIIGGVGYAVYFYATHFKDTILLVPEDSVRFFFGKLAAYFGPLMFGAAFFLTLFKTFFARRPKPSKPCTLSLGDAPALFPLIRRVCRLVGAPVPRRVQVNCEVNAGVNFRGLFGKDFTLTIGLPLAAGLDMREFTGLLAHELSHLNQSTAIRLTYIIRTINLWFARGVYERDLWDFRLAFWTSVTPRFIAIFLLMAQIGIWISRRILWCLMTAGHGLSCFMLRQMEYEADLCQIKVVGTSSFISTVHRLRHLNLASEGALRHMQKTWFKHRELYDRLPEFILHRARRASASANERAVDEALAKKTSLFDSHPSDASRIDRARRANQSGLVAQQPGPASSLFAEFQSLSRQVTRNQYEIWFGPSFDPNDIVAMEDTVQQAEHDHAADPQHLDRYLLGVHDYCRWLMVPQDRVLSNFREAQAIESSGVAREQMQTLLPQAQAALLAFQDADASMLAAWQAVYLAQVGFLFAGGRTELPPSDPEGLYAAALRARQEAAHELERFEQSAVSRMVLSLQLIRLPRLIAASPEALKMRTQAYELLSVLALLGEIAGPLGELRRECSALQVLLEHREKRPRSAACEALCSKLNTRILGSSNRIRAAVWRTKFPFAHARGVITIGEFIQSRETHEDPFQRTLLEAGSQYERLFTLYKRIFASLILISEWVENKVIES